MITLDQSTLLAIRDALIAWTPALGESIATEAARNAAQALCCIDGDPVEVELVAMLRATLLRVSRARLGHTHIEIGPERLPESGAAAIGEALINALRLEATRAALHDALGQGGLR